MCAIFSSCALTYFYRLSLITVNLNLALFVGKICPFFIKVWHMIDWLGHVRMRGTWCWSGCKIETLYMVGSG